MFNLYFAVYGQTYVFDHLSGVQFDGKHALYFLGISGDRFCRERPQSDGTEQAELDAFRGRLVKASSAVAFKAISEVA